MQLEHQLALLHPFARVADRLPAAAVPEDDGARPVLFGRNRALESTVADRMVLDVHRHPLLGRIEAGSLRQGPTQEHAIEFEAEVVVQPARPVFLDDIDECFFRAAPGAGSPLSRRFGRDLEVALFVVARECAVRPGAGACHSPAPARRLTPICGAGWASRTRAPWSVSCRLRPASWTQPRRSRPEPAPSSPPVRLSSGCA
jgi:hypothetical protein